MALTIRINEQQEDLIAKLCRRLDINTSSKLLLHLLEQYEGQQELIKDLQSTNRCLYHDIEEAELVIHRFKASFGNLMEYKGKDHIK